MRERGARPFFDGFRLSPVMFHVKHRRHPQVLHRKSKAYTAGKSQDIHQVFTRISTAIPEDDPQPRSALPKNANALKYKWLSYSRLKDTGEHRE